MPDGMGTDAEPPVGPHLLTLADVGSLGFDCALKPAPAPASGGMPSDLNTPVTTSDLPAFFPSPLELPPIISGATRTTSASTAVSEPWLYVRRRDRRRRSPPPALDR